MIVVDQSVRIEDTSHDTVLALHDTDADKPSALYGRHNTRAVLIPAEVKRRCFGELRDRGLLRKTIVLRVFAAALFLLL
ncbi:MAG: hypothetical protein QME94_03380 [Anaerolineae bacterium]|nr:hypothetical protein [Anaerolineae bacterium]